jgi:hypothetical protein
MGVIGPHRPLRVRLRLRLLIRQPLPLLPLLVAAQVAVAVQAGGLAARAAAGVQTLA